MLLFCFHLDVDVNTGRHFQSLKSINSLLSGSHDVDQSLVSSLLELFSGVLVLVYCSQNGNNFLLGRKRHGTTYLESGIRTTVLYLYGISAVASAGIFMFTAARSIFL